MAWFFSRAKWKFTVFSSLVSPKEVFSHANRCATREKNTLSVVTQGLHLYCFPTRLPKAAVAMDWLQFWQPVLAQNWKVYRNTFWSMKHTRWGSSCSLSLSQWRWLSLWGDTSTSPALHPPLPRIHHLRYPLMHLWNPTLYQHLQWTVKHALPSWYKWPKTGWKKD